jgi:putative addiction module killer protein
MTRYDIEVYETENGDAPFQDWLDGLKNAEVKTQVVARIRRASLGNFGDWKSLKGGGGIHEMRVHAEQGFRVFYAIVGQTVILLLVGSSKKDQDRTIARAKSYFEDYKRRMRS